MNKLLTGLLVLPSIALLLVGCSTVETKELGKEQFSLTHFYAEPPRDLNSRKIAKMADQACPQGFDVLSKNAAKASEFGYDDATCTGASCDYVLEWRILCVEKTKQEESIFGSK